MKQHTQPCKECPWRRIAPRGWLGDELTMEEFVAAVHGEMVLGCHMLAPSQCAGAAICRANTCKSPRSPEILRLPADREQVFSSGLEFKQYHNGKWTKKSTK